MKRPVTSTLKISSKIKKAVIKLALPKPLEEIHTLLIDQKRKLPNSRRKINTGISILFNGPEKSGKTAMATMLANQAGKDLYKVELSKLVSKYIGETEKNLSALFKMAEDKEWILFFDEADAIFGKRTEVKDSHDRYANLEVSYLIQRIEEYNGLVILSSNVKSNIDKAFLRRIRYSIPFPLE